MLSKRTKANGHIVQSDWNQTDPKQFDYIHNKPEIPSIDGLASEDFVDTQVNKLYKKIVTRNCEINTEQLNVQINVYEPLDTDGTATNYFGVSFPISIPEQFIGQDISVSIDDIALGDVAVNSSTTSEYIGITNSKEDYFTDFEDPRCLASNDGSGWTTNEVTHNVQSTSAYLMLFFVTPIPADQLDNYRLKYSDKLKLAYSIKTYTEVGDDFIYDKDLHSNLETHYSHPIDETAFQNFIMSYDQNIAQEWVIYFKAAATDIFDRFSTVNIVSTNGDSNSIEVCWIGSKPKCLLNKQYKATFKIINEKLYGLLEFLEEQPIEITENTDLNNLLVPGTYFYDSARSLTITNKPTAVTSFNLSVKYLGYNTTDKIATFTQEINSINSISNTKYVAKLRFDTTTNTIKTASTWQQVLATQNSYWGIAQGGTGSTTTQGVQATLDIARPNLLINGNFSVCQRTEGSWNTLGQYTYDRWRIWPGCTVTSGTVARITDTNGIKLIPGATLKTSYTNFGIIQALHPSILTGLLNKTVTLSVKIRASSSISNKMYVGFTNTNGTVRHKNGSVLTAAAGTILSVTLQLTSSILNKGLGCYIGFYSATQNTEVVLDYAKLEIGNTYTPCILKRYDEELLDCQKYYVMYNTYSSKLIGFTGADSKYCYIDLTLPASLTKSPQITCIDEETLAADGKIVVLTSFNETLCSKYPITEISYYTSNNLNTITVRFTVNSTSNLGANLCYLQNCPPLILDAELY